MKRLAILLVAIVICAFITSLAQAEDAAPKKIRVLLTYGGHGFQQEPFFAMFDAMEDIEYTKAPLPESADLLKPGLEKAYDVIVCYDMVGGFTPEQQQAFVKLLQTGIGYVSMHHNLGAHRGWPKYREIVGGAYLFGPEEIDGVRYPGSNYAHDASVPVTVVDGDHPITKGMKDFTIHDEVYGRCYIAKDVRILLKTDHPKSIGPLLWTKKYGNSPICHFMLGHDAKSWTNPAFPEILHRAMIWAAATDGTK